MSKPTGQAGTKASATNRQWSAEEVLEFIDSMAEKTTLGLASGLQPYQIFDITQEQLEALYALGYARYSEKHYDEAEEIFAFTARLEPLEPKHLKGVASARQARRDYQGALDAWSAAALLGMADTECSYYAAQCLIMMGNKEKAAAAFAVVRGQVGDNVDHALYGALPTLEKQIAAMG